MVYAMLLRTVYKNFRRHFRSCILAFNCCCVFASYFFGVRMGYGVKIEKKIKILIFKLTLHIFNKITL
jgi:hypothetical protein